MTVNRGVGVDMDGADNRREPVDTSRLPLASCGSDVSSDVSDGRGESLSSPSTTATSTCGVTSSCTDINDDPDSDMVDRRNDGVRSPRTVKCNGKSDEPKTRVRKKKRKRQKKKDEPVYSDIIRCQICGDKASGMHYGVYSCEGCKGFFRRTQRLKLTYKNCPFWGQPDGCIINIESRNKCQYCRYQKCLSLGMSSQAVRMGRVPIKEVRRIKQELDEESGFDLLTDDDKEFVSYVERISEKFNNMVCTITEQDAKKFWNRCSQPFRSFMPNGSQLVQGLQLDLKGPPREITSRAEMAKQCFVSMEVTIEKFANYAKEQEKFKQLSNVDQLTLFKGAALEVCAVLSAGRYYHGVYRFPEINTYIRRDVAENSPFGKVTTYIDEMIFYEMFNTLNLSTIERAVYCTFLLYSPDREGLENRQLVEQHQEHLVMTLYRLLKRNHPDRPGLFFKLMDMTIHLRTLIPGHIKRLEQIKMRCNGNLPAELSPLLSEVYGNQLPLGPTERNPPAASATPPFLNTNEEGTETDSLIVSETPAAATHPITAALTAALTEEGAATVSLRTSSEAPTADPGTSASEFIDNVGGIRRLDQVETRREATNTSLSMGAHFPLNFTASGTKQNLTS